jgi:hypothetical protein
MTDNLKHKIIKYLNSEYGDLEQFQMGKYPDNIFFMKDGKFIFYYHKKNGYTGISNNKIWSFLESFFGLEYKEIQVLTKKWVEEHYKLRVTTTGAGGVIPPDAVEKHYKLGVTTTLPKMSYFDSLVEEHHKLKTNDR